MQITMKKERSTPGTYVYKADETSGGKAIIRSLYITQARVDGDPPETITVEIKEIKEVGVPAKSKK